MQTLLELDEDVAKLLDAAVERSGKPLVHIVNQALRSELQGRVPFTVEPWDMGLPAEWTSGKVEELIDLLEGPDRRC